MSDKHHVTPELESLSMKSDLESLRIRVGQLEGQMFSSPLGPLYLLFIDYQDDLECPPKLDHFIAAFASVGACKMYHRQCIGVGRIAPDGRNETVLINKDHEATIVKLNIRPVVTFRPVEEYYSRGMGEDPTWGTAQLED